MVDEAATKRGSELLVPYGLGLDNVQTLALSRNHFRNVAAAKQFASLHGFCKSNPASTRDHYVFEVSPASHFVSDTLRSEKISRNISVTVGERIEVSVNVEQPAVVAQPAQPVMVPEAPQAEPETPEVEPDAQEEVQVHIEARTTVADNHFHEALVEAGAGDGETGPPTDSRSGHTHRVVGFEVQEAEGHTHQLVLAKSSNMAKCGELFMVSKADEDNEYEGQSVRTIGIVLKPEVVDAQGSLISAEEIESANLKFMKDFGTVGLMHQKSVSDKVFIVQNAIAPTDIQFPVANGQTKLVKAGTWYQEHYSEDPEIVGKVKRGEITGLSIGGFAQHVPFEKSLVSQDAKQAVLRNNLDAEAVAKAEGDVPDHRLVNLEVHEVSLVDAAANEEKFLVVKRLTEDQATSAESLEPNQADTSAEVKESEMSIKAEEIKEAAETEVEQVEKSEEVAEVVEGSEQVEKSEEQAEETQEVEAVEKSDDSAEEAEAVVEETQVDVAKLVGDAVAKAVAEAVAPLNEKLSEVEKNLAEQAEHVAKSAAIVSVAKGESNPAETSAVEKNDKEEKSLWSGSVIRKVVESRSGR